jgi:hypothetical protein
METKLQQSERSSAFATGYKWFSCWGRMKRRCVYFTCFSVISALLLCGCDGKRPGLEAAKVLTTGKWGRQIQSGTLQENYVYTFFTNGTYRACVQNNFGMRAKSGTWSLNRSSNGQVVLYLNSPEADYFCLWRESILHYDTKRDVLAVTALRVGGEQELRHLCGTNQEPTIQHPGKPHSWHFAPRSPRGAFGPPR